MFLVWAAVAAIGALLWARFTPRDETAAPPVNLGKVLRDPRVWQVAALFTFQNLVYYTVATWTPFLLSGHTAADIATTRSEERRVGKECKYRGMREQRRKKGKQTCTCSK